MVVCVGKGFDDVSEIVRWVRLKMYVEGGGWILGVPRVWEGGAV